MAFLFGSVYILEFRELDASPGKTEVKQGRFVKFIFHGKGLFKRNI